MGTSLKQLLLEIENKWEKPSFEEERSEFEKIAEELDLDMSELERNFTNGELRMFPKKIWNQLKNTDSTKTTSFDDLVQVIQKMKKTDPEFDRDWKGIALAIKKGLPMKAPIILKHKKAYYLIAGNTRLMVAKAMDNQPFIWLMCI